MGDPRHFLYTLESRAFSPYKTFGGGFQGDNRGFGTRADADSRVHSSTLISPGQGTAGKVQTYSDTTRGPHLGVYGQGAANGIPNGAILASAIDGGTRYLLHAWGSNPLVPPAPTVDNHADISVRLGTGTIDISAKFTADSFGAFEYTIRDPSNSAIFLGGIMPSSPQSVMGLFGDFQKPVGSLEMKISCDKDGNFTGIKSAEFRGPDGKVVGKASEQTIDGWNQQIQKALTPPGMPDPEKSAQDRLKDNVREAGQEMDKPGPDVGR